MSGRDRRDRTTIDATWTLIANPGFEGEPRPLRAACHDGSPFLTIRCDCGHESHMHESKVEHHIGEIAVRCPACHRALIFPPGFFKLAFQKMRDDGWVAN